MGPSSSLHRLGWREILLFRVFDYDVIPCAGKLTLMISTLSGCCG
jgi:hypothetical protein